MIIMTILKTFNKYIKIRFFPITIFILFRHIGSICLMIFNSAKLDNINNMVKYTINK